MNRANSVMESSQKLELFISCRSLADMDTFSKSDPYVILQVKKNNQWFEHARTETIMDNLNPNFAKSVIIDYFFEVQQPLKFICYDFDGPNSSEVPLFIITIKLIGHAETTLGAIAGAKDQLLVLELSNNTRKKRGKIIIRADQVQMINDQIIMKIKGINFLDTKFWFWKTTSPFLRFYRLRKDDNKPILVHETEPVYENRNPLWQEINILAQKLCNGDYLMPIMIELYDWHTSGDHQYMGQASISVTELIQNKNVKLQLANKTTKKPVGEITFISVKSQLFIISSHSFKNLPSWISFKAALSLTLLRQSTLQLPIRTPIILLLCTILTPTGL